MSLTVAEQVLGAIHEDALNDLLRAFFSARPRYRRYGSPAFAPATTVNETQMGAIPFPGVPGGIDWRVSFDIPQVDLHKQSMQLPPQLALNPGQFSLRTAVELCINCATRRDNRPPSGAGKDDRPPPPKADHEMCTRLEVYGIGHIDAWSDSAGNGEVRLRVDAVEIVDIAPDSLESVLECLLRMVLDAALAHVVLPLRALRAGAFRLVVANGPLIEEDQIKVYGNV